MYKVFQKERVPRTLLSLEFRIHLTLSENHYMIKKKLAKGNLKALE